MSTTLNLFGWNDMRYSKIRWEQISTCSCLNDHIDHCLELQANSDASCAKEAIKDFKKISK